MTFNELYAKILEVCPLAEIGEDNDGQLLVYTNMTRKSDDTVEDMP